MPLDFQEKLHTKSYTHIYICKVILFGEVYGNIGKAIEVIKSSNTYLILNNKFSNFYDYFL